MKRFPLYLRALTILLPTLLATIGCKKEQAAAPPAPPAPATPASQPAGPRTVKFKELTLTVPVDWTDKTEDSGNQLYLFGPPEGEWPANLWVRIRNNPGNRSAGELVDDMSEQLARTREDFGGLNKQTSRHPAGLDMGRASYKSKNTTRRIDLGQWFIAIVLPDTRWIEIHANSDIDSWEKSQPVIEQILNSMQFKK
jgi:hypothetical protein